jgi:NAD(P)-dependent dehydrogenase (short-subunit alcohol dehydrogenase family)
VLPVPGGKPSRCLFVAEFARRGHGIGVTANAADPGFVRTNLGRNATGPFFLKVMRPFQASPEKAARTPVYLATAPEVATTSGGYFANSRPKTPTPRPRPGHRGEAVGPQR